jgi:hypothetical protein
VVEAAGEAGVETTSWYPADCISSPESSVATSGRELNASIETAASTETVGDGRSQVEGIGIVLGLPSDNNARRSVDAEALPVPPGHMLSCRHFHIDGPAVDSVVS